MMCQRCGLLLQTKLYKCVDCYNDDLQDCYMCYQCKDEHNDANENQCEYEVINHE